MTFNPTYLSVWVENSIPVRFESYFQQPTYLGLLMGIPDDERNSEKINETLEKAKNWPFENHGIPIYLVDPDKTYERIADIHGRSKMYSWLPYQCCMAWLTTYEYQKDRKRCGSHLVVVWFQNELEMLVSEDTLKKFQSIPWSKVSEDFDV